MNDQQPAAPRAPLLPRVLIVLVTLWALIGYLIVPWLVHAFAPRIAADALDADLEIGDVHFDPFALRLRMHEIVLRGPLEAATFDAEPLVHIGLLDVNLSALSLLTLGPSVVIHLDAPDLRVELDDNGALNLAALLPPAPETETDDDPESAADGPPTLPDLTVSLHLDDGGVHFIDRSRAERFETRVTGIDLALEALQLQASDAAPLDLSAELEGARLRVSGDLSARPAARIELALTDFPLALVNRWLADTTPARDLSGQLDAAAQLVFEDGALRLDAGEATLSALAVAVDAPLEADLAVERIAVRDVVGNPLQPDLEIGALELLGPRFAAIHDRDTIAALTGDPASQNGAEPTGAPAGASAGENADDPDASGQAASGASAPAPRIVIGAARIRDMALALTDRTLDGAPTLEVDRLGVELGRIVPVGGGSDDPATPLHVELRALGSGELTFDGSVALAPQLSGRLDLSALDLTALAPWARHHAQLGLQGAMLEFGLDVDFDGAARIGGDLQLTDLDLNDPGGVRLIAWDRLALGGLQLDSGARSARIDSIALQAPAARFARLTDGSTNLDGIGTAAGSDDADQDPPREQPAPSAAADGADGSEGSEGSGDDASGDEADAQALGTSWSWSVGSATLNDGRLNFVDETLVIPFGTAVEAIGAELSDLSSADEAPARIVLDGRVPPNGTMRMETRLTLLAPLEDSVIDVRFRQVPMPQLSPYTGTFAGRSIAGGRLDLDLGYRLDAGALDAENRIVATALRLGPPIDSPDAMDLPLDLALALLRDGNDQIVLEVPVSGDVDDPSFDITPVIMRAIRNAITGIVSAPFRMLGALLGGGGDETLDRVTFPFGSATIPEEELDRFVSLETALNQRPALVLELSPTRAPEADRDALRIAALEARIEAIRAADTNGSDADAGAGTLDEATAVRRLYARDYGEEALAAIVTQYEEGDAARGGPGAALAGELRGRLLADTRVPDEALAALARDRALAVRDQLAAAGLDPARIRIRDAAVDGEAGDDGERVIMKFDLAPGDAGAAPPDSASRAGTTGSTGAAGSNR